MGILNDFSLEGKVALVTGGILWHRLRYCDGLRTGRSYHRFQRH